MAAGLKPVAGPRGSGGNREAISRASTGRCLGITLWLQVGRQIGPLPRNLGDHRFFPYKVASLNRQSRESAVLATMIMLKYAGWVPHDNETVGSCLSLIARVLVAHTA